MSVKTKSAIAIIGSKNNLESMIPKTLCSVKEKGVWGICIFPMRYFIDGITNFDQALWYKFETKETGKYRNGKFVSCNRPANFLTKELKKPDYLYKEVGSYLVSRKVFKEDDFVLCVGYYGTNKTLGDYQFGVSGTVEYLKEGKFETTQETCIRETEEETGIKIDKDLLINYGTVKFLHIPVAVYVYSI